MSLPFLRLCAAIAVFEWVLLTFGDGTRPSLCKPMAPVTCEP